MNDQDETIAKNAPLDSKQLTKRVLDLLDNDQRRDILSRRLGLFGPREPYETIGASIGVTKQAIQGSVQNGIAILSGPQHQEELRTILGPAEVVLARRLRKLGGVARVSDLAALLGSEHGDAAENRLNFLANFCPVLTVIRESKSVYGAVGVSGAIDSQVLEPLTSTIATLVAHAGVPLSSAELAGQLGREDVQHVAAAARISKEVKQTDGLWEPTVAPPMKSLSGEARIYAILKRHPEPMHFTAITKAVNADMPGRPLASDSIRLTLAQSSTFIRVGKGLFALAEERERKSWTELITDVLREADGPLQKADIVKRVHLLNPHLNIHSINQYLTKPEFRKLGRGVYELADAAREAAASTNP